MPAIITAKTPSFLPKRTVSDSCTDHNCVFVDELLFQFQETGCVAQ